MPELFSSEHWSQILASAEAHALVAPARNRRAERLWASAYDAWHAENKARAGTLFRAAVEAEPGMADGYLGLYALSDGFDEEVCQALAHTAERLREQQRRLEKRLGAYYFPLFFTPVSLDSADDARLALVRHLSRSGQFTAAHVWLERCHQQDSRTLALKGRVALDAGDFEEATRCLQQVAALDEELRGDAHLGVGLALEALGLLEGAVVSFQAAVEHPGPRPARRYARYRLALVQEASGESQEATRLLEQIYAEDTGYLDVATRLGLTDVQAATASDPWDVIVAELESGRVINDPTIHDNH